MSDIDLKKLQADVNRILAEAHGADELRGEPINWGDLKCWSARRWVDQDGDWGWTVYVEEADSSKLGKYVDTKLSELGYPGIDVETEW